VAESETLVFRASLGPKIYRDIEIAGTSSLYTLAQAIVRSFDFDFDHAFGFYSKLKGNIYDSPVRYELFVDIGESEGDARSVKRTRVIKAFPSVGSSTTATNGNFWSSSSDESRRSRRSSFPGC
jgi:hypothetical protein